MKDVSDQLRISREKLSYIVDSTAAPVATLGISSWVAFQLSLIEEGYSEAGVAEANRQAQHLRGVPVFDPVQHVRDPRDRDGRHRGAVGSRLRGDADGRTPVVDDREGHP